MGVIRGILLVLVAVLLFLSFLTLNLLLTLSSSLDYEHVEKESTVIAKDILEEMNVAEIVRQNYPMIQFYCMNHSDYVLSYQGFTFDIPCSVVSQGQDAVINEWIKDYVHNLYYTKYDCNFIDCFGESPIPLFLISEKTFNFFKDKTYFSLIASLLLFALLFLLVEKKANAFILSGSLLIGSSIPFIKLDYLLSFLSDKMIFQLLWIFFSQSFYVSIKIMLVGIALLVFGILIDIFKIGFFISNLISKIRGERKEKTDKKAVKKPNKKSK